jgi:hypothetical protein
MGDIFIESTIETPEVDFRFSKHALSLSGEAYPENASEFFRPLLLDLESYLKTAHDRDIEFNFRLTYFNSASTKMLYSLFGLLNGSAAGGKNRIVLYWHHDKEDDTMLEYGESVQEDFGDLDFRLVEAEAA